MDKCPKCGSNKLGEGIAGTCFICGSRSFSSSVFEQSGECAARESGLAKDKQIAELQGYFDEECRIRRDLAIKCDQIESDLAAARAEIERIVAIVEEYEKPYPDIADVPATTIREIALGLRRIMAKRFRAALTQSAPSEVKP